VPQQLKKTTPNFHLVLTAITDDDAFCKTSLSGMLLNYPPPTVVNLYQEFDNDIQRERDTLQGIRHYLHNNKYVQDDDLMLIVDGENSWFQLPSDVMIKQYVRVLEDANARLLVRYGTDKNGHQKFNQSILPRIRCARATTWRAIMRRTHFCQRICMGERRGSTLRIGRRGI
jgi:hypothetical protein